MDDDIDTLTVADLLRELPSRIHEVYASFVRTMPDHPAFVEAGRAWSYRQFSDAVDAAARDLSRLGIRPGDRVLFASENSVALSALLFAASKLDAWAITVNPRLSPRELDLIAQHSGARRTIFNSALSREAADHAKRRGAALAPIGPFGGLAIDALNEAVELEPVNADPAVQVAALMYTSGTTGMPKGVMLTHQNLLVAARVSGLLRNTNPADGIYGGLPMSHIVGFSILLIATLMHGATLHVVAKPDPGALAEAIASGGITTLFGVPATYQRLLEYKAIKGFSKLKRGKLRMMLVAGAPLDTALKARVEQEFGIPLLNNYGITECSPGLSGVREKERADDETVGRLLPGVEQRIVDRQGRPVAVGEVGELHVRGPNVMKGYYRAFDLTAAAINKQGWFNTGDLARITPSGHLYIVGRTKELIVRSGFNVYPAEVEAVLNSHESVVQSAVVGRAVEGNEEVVAYVQLLPGARVSIDELQSFAASRLTAYKRPCEIIILEALPAASSGKILKGKLREMAASAAASSASTAR